MPRLSRTLVLTSALAVIAVGLVGTPEQAPAAPPQGREVPKHAVQVAPNVYSLGTARDRLGRVVEGYLFVHPRTNAKKPDNPGNGGGKGGGGGGAESSCFTLLARGAKWRGAEDFLIDPTNTSTDGTIDGPYIEGSVTWGVDTWEAVSADDIFGSLGAGIVDGADENQPDGKNEVEFAPISGSGTLAYTITWGIFSGPPSGRELVEWDMVFDDDGDWVWTDETAAGASTAPNAIDFRTVLLHELGHALGLDHSPSGCTDEVMQAYYGGLDHDLGAGDTAGAQEMYGSP